MSSIQLVSCPQCGATLLGDSPLCHRCHHVLNTQVEELTRRDELPTDAAVREDLETCPKCGETYRKGLVRCWSCGTFTRDEIASAYERRLQGRTESDGGFHELPVLRVQSSVNDEAADSAQNAPFSEMAQSGSQGGYDLDFEETPEESFAGDDDFELGEDVQLGAFVQEEESESYSLAPIEPPVRPQAALPPVAEDAPIPLMEPPVRAVAPLPEPEPEPDAEGDELLKIARQQEKDSKKAKESLHKKLGGFIVYCPQGCRIRVQDRHRGKTGRCPKCHALFLVPLAQKKTGEPTKTATTSPADAATTGAGQAAGKFTRWQLDLRLHTVQPQKLKLKPDSLLNEFQAVDAGFAADELLLVTLAAGGGMFGSAAKKKDAVRTAVQEHLRSKPTLEGLPGAAKLSFSRDSVGQFALAQPSPLDSDSLFGQIPVFGNGRIAVKLPKQGDAQTLQYLSFSLTEFRQFADNLREIFGIEGFGTRTEIPLTDEFQTAPCVVSSEPVRGLLGLPYYEKDPAIKLDVSGWRCGVCNAVVSEAARDKAKLGGAKGKAIAKAKCPKCSQKMGSNPWYQRASEPAPAAAATAAADPATDAPAAVE